MTASLETVPDTRDRAATEPTQRRRGHVRLDIDGATPTRLGMKFGAEFRFEDWRSLGRRLGTYSNASHWWLGDWLDFGRQRYGSRYKAGIALTGLEYKTLRNYAYVARQFPLSRRRDALSFQHHAEVAPLCPEQQDAWLDRAEREGWSRTQLRRYLQAELRRPAGAPPTQPALVSLRVTEEHPWLRAARRCDCDLQSWVERTLDEAADALLDRGAQPA